MLIKKLSRQEIDEGLTLALVNSPDATRKPSPVMFQKDDEPVNLVKCSTGYWVCYEPGKYLRDEKGRLMVLGQRECQIARARYLFHFADMEKQQETEKLLSSRRDKVQKAIENMRKNIDSSMERSNGNRCLLEFMTDEHQQKYKAETERITRLLPQMEDMYRKVVESFEKGNIAELLDYFDIEKAENPVFTARYDNDNEMRVLKNSFGKAALDAAGGNIERLLARLQIEKEYSL